MHAEDIAFAILYLTFEAAALKGRRYKGKELVIFGAPF